MILEILPVQPFWEQRPANLVRPFDIVIFSPFMMGPYILHFKQYPSVVTMVLIFHYQRCNLNTSVGHPSKFMFFTLKGGVQRVIFVKNWKHIATESKKTVYCGLFCWIRLFPSHLSSVSLSHNSHYATQCTTEIPAIWLRRTCPSVQYRRSRRCQQAVAPTTSLRCLRPQRQGLIEPFSKSVSNQLLMHRQIESTSLMNSQALSPTKHLCTLLVSA